MILSNLRFEDIGNWRLEDSGCHEENLKKPLVEHPRIKAMNLNGRVLKATVVDNWPFFGIETLDNGTAIASSGVDVEIINVLKSKLNFT